MALFSAAFSGIRHPSKPLPYHLIFLYEISTQSAKFIVQYNKVLNQTGDDKG